MSSANPDFRNASSTQDVHAAADPERDFGNTIQRHLGKVWQYPVTILLVNSTVRLFHSLYCLLMTTSSWVRYQP